MRRTQEQNNTRWSAVGVTRGDGPSRQNGGGQLTRLADTKDLTQDECELDAAPGKGTLVLVFPAAVLQDKLGDRSTLTLQIKF